MNPQTVVIFFSTALLFGAAGCATLMHGTTQAVNIRTTPPGAYCSVGKFVIQSPAVVYLERTSDHVIQCDMEGYFTSEESITYRSSSILLMAGNIFFGLIPGIITDEVTGAAGELSPTVVNLRMLPLAKAGTSAGPSTPLPLLDLGPKPN